MILCTGGTGLLGKNLQCYLESIKNTLEEDVVLLGTSSANIYNKKTNTFDYLDGSNNSPINLTDTNECVKLFDNIKPSKVLHFAGLVGGVKATTNRQGDFFRTNLLINNNVLEACRLNKVAHLISVLSSSVYNPNHRIRTQESKLYAKNPHESKFGYAYAKRMLEVQTKTYRDQYSCNFKCVIPTNLYGIYDNFDVENGHAIPAIIHKLHLAKLNNSPYVELFGTGNEVRQFTYTKDLVAILWELLTKNTKFELLNIGNPKEIKIKDVVGKIAKRIGYTGEIVYNNTYGGQEHKQISIKEFRKLNKKPLNWTSIDEGIELTCDWFIENYPKVRGCY